MWFKKKKTKLELASEVVESLVKQTNKKINELGQYDYDLYNALIRIQEQFDKIRNVPSDKQLQYQAIKKVSMAWKQQVDQIESDYESAKKTDIGSGAAGGAFGVGVATLGPAAAMGVATTWGGSFNRNRNSVVKWCCSNKCSVSLVRRRCTVCRRWWYGCW